MDDRQVIKYFPSGEVVPPPSKSFGHRALICAALAALGPERGESLISKAELSEDIEATRRALNLLGADIQWGDKGLTVRPGQARSQKVIDCGESGSTLRFLLPIAAVLSPGLKRFTGQGRLLKRPLTPYEPVFAASKIKFKQSETELSVEGQLLGGQYQLPGDVSSQFVSGLLLALALAEKDSLIQLTSPLESAPYVDITLAVMKDFGLEIQKPKENQFFIPGRQVYQARKYELEADFSQAAFFLAAAALGRPVSCRALNPASVQGDRAIIDILTQMGAEIIWSADTVTVKAQRLKALTVDVREIPDLVPVLSSLCALAKGRSRIINAARLRLKESDRLSSMAQELRKLGAEIHEEADSLSIVGQESLTGGAVVEAHNDHRVAMALAVAAIGCHQTIEIIGASSVKKSYPNFWADFGRELR